MYRSLDADNIINTAQQLNTRIGERFPASGLRKVCEELLAEARQAADTARIRRHEDRFESYNGRGPAR